MNLRSFQSLSTFSSEIVFSNHCALYSVASVIKLDLVLRRIWLQCFELNEYFTLGLILPLVVLTVSSKTPYAKHITASTGEIQQENVKKLAEKHAM